MEKYYDFGLKPHTDRNSEISVKQNLNKSKGKK